MAFPDYSPYFQVMPLFLPCVQLMVGWKWKLLDAI